MTPASQPSRPRSRTPKWLWFVLLGVVVFIAILIGVGVASNMGGGEAEPAATESSAPTETQAVEAPVVETTEPAPAVTAAPTVEAAPTEQAESLADTVWAAVLENFGGEVSSGSPLFAVTEVEDVSTGTIRVYVQQNLDDAGRDEIARHTINMGAFNNDELQTVVVRDASGVDSNHYR